MLASDPCYNFNDEEEEGIVGDGENNDEERQTSDSRE